MIPMKGYYPTLLRPYISTYYVERLTACGGRMPESMREIARPKLFPAFGK